MTSLINSKDTKQNQLEKVYLKDYQVPSYLVKTIDLVFSIDDKQQVVTVTSTSKYYLNPSLVRNYNNHNANDLTQTHADDHSITGAPFTPPVVTLAPLPPLVLNGNAQLQLMVLDDQILTDSDYCIDKEQETLTISKASLLADCFTLQITTHIFPWQNKTCMGLFATNDNLITQCEPQGFRKITYYQDRPDVMAKFTVTIIANPRVFSTMLANGNLLSYDLVTEDGQKRDDLAMAVWSDPFPKPCYLFALVVGSLKKITDEYVTLSGRRVLLEIYSEEHSIKRLDHAMSSLKRAFAWDEQRFGLECDLDRYMIVATSDFNMGAMENKGLNIFNIKYVAASKDTATDNDFMNVESVIAHEYFHNWTGNRVTCRDWFQLSLKEGLTVFRDQEFSQDLHSRSVNRIKDVNVLKTYQFAEDSGALAHPVRPSSYVEIDNFYTATVYEKGAEVVRMYQTMLGIDGFRKGLNLYLKRHDGQAATCEDFLFAMRDANDGYDKQHGFNWQQFMNWYNQPGLVTVNLTTSYDESTGDYMLVFTQSLPKGLYMPRESIPHESVFHEPLPMLIPIKIGILDHRGVNSKLTRAMIKTSTGGVLEVNGDLLLLLTTQQDNFTISTKSLQTIPSTARPILSLLRDFSAPIQLIYDGYSEQERLLLAKHDSDEFNRIEQLQFIQREVIIELYKQIAQQGVKYSAFMQEQGLLKQEKWHALAITIQHLQEIISEIITNASLTPQFRALALSLPTFSELLPVMKDNINPLALHQAITIFNKQLALSLLDRLLETYNDNLTLHYNFDDYGKRSLKNACLYHIVQGLTLGDYQSNASTLQMLETLCLGQLHNADNMTDTIAVLQAINHHNILLRENIFSEFYTTWCKDSQVIDKWFALQALSDCVTIEKLNKLLVDKAFIATNPNKIYALLRSFTMNQRVFNTEDGYDFITNQIIVIDKFNPQVASRLASGFMNISMLSANFKQMGLTSLKTMLNKQPHLSKNVAEVVGKILAASN